jgi:hypothetical protein
MPAGKIEPVIGNELPSGDFPRGFSADSPFGIPLASRRPAHGMPVPERTRIRGAATRALLNGINHK